MAARPVPTTPHIIGDLAKRMDLGGECARRLLTDVRAPAVWSQIRRQAKIRVDKDAADFGCRLSGLQPGGDAMARARVVRRASRRLARWARLVARVNALGADHVRSSDGRVALRGTGESRQNFNVRKEDRGITHETN